jgi:hypothetical protein
MTSGFVKEKRSFKRRNIDALFITYIKIIMCRKLSIHWHLQTSHCYPIQRVLQSWVRATVGYSSSEEIAQKDGVLISPRQWWFCLKMPLLDISISLQKRRWWVTQVIKKNWECFFEFINQIQNLCRIDQNIRGIITFCTSCMQFFHQLHSSN